MIRDRANLVIRDRANWFSLGAIIIITRRADARARAQHKTNTVVAVGRAPPGEGWRYGGVVRIDLRQRMGLFEQVGFEPAAPRLLRRR